MSDPQLVESEIMTNQIATLRTAVNLIRGNGEIVLSEKTGKTGSLAMAIAYAGRNERQMLAQTLYMGWLNNGQFRPIINDVLGSGLVAKAAVPYAMPVGMTDKGPVTKEMFLDFAKRVVGVVDQSGKEQKGKKLFCLELLRRASAPVVDIE